MSVFWHYKWLRLKCVREKKQIFHNSFEISHSSLRRERQASIRRCAELLVVASRCYGQRRTAHSDGTSTLNADMRLLRQKVLYRPPRNKRKASSTMFSRRGFGRVKGC